MNFDDIEGSRLTELLHEIVSVKSPVGYYPDIQAYLKKMLEPLGYDLGFDGKGTTYVLVRGRDSSKTVCVGAHVDTIGLVVRGFNDDGTLRVRQVGGVNYHAVEGETCYILCRDGRVVTGQVICNKHSVHVFEDARTVERDENNMSISIIDDVKSPDDARALGVSEGALVSIDPHFESFENGYIVTRHIDDKGAVAVALDTLRWLAETGEKPAYDTYFAFPVFEEIGYGGSFVPEGVSEYVAMDITLLGPDYHSDEHQVGVIASDAKGPYNWDLTNRLIRGAEKFCDEGKWNVQVCFHYSTDAAAASHAANNLSTAAFGMACLNSHGRERCHVDALIQTERLCRAYVMGEC